MNVNFWITDDSSNLGNENGGMIVWKRMPNSDASFDEYNSTKIIDKLTDEVKDADFIKIPYKSNRAVIFNSKLYHVTDDIEFKNNYEDRRVNVTFLYS